MRRYRGFAVEFDTRATLLSTDIRKDWDPAVRKLWRQNQRQVRKEIALEFGRNRLHDKLGDFAAFGPIPFSVIAYHNDYFRQIRSAFVSGGYYPALTAACALGERILHHLILE